MTLAETQVRAKAPPIDEDPRPHWFTRDEYFRLDELGFFRGKRVERFEGRILDMSPQNNPHFLSVSLVASALQSAFVGEYWIRSQGPLRIGEGSDPEPDVSVVLGQMRQHKQTPTTAILLVEVADSSLSYDRNEKSSLYAKAGVQEYWIVNIVNNCVEVMRDPIADSTALLGFRYKSIVTFRPPEFISPLANPKAKIPIADLLP